MDNDNTPGRRMITVRMRQQLWQDLQLDCVPNDIAPGDVVILRRTDAVSLEHSSATYLVVAVANRDDSPHHVNVHLLGNDRAPGSTWRLRR